MLLHIFSLYPVLEFSFDFGEFNYLVIAGRHVNGWYIAVPNHGKCVEAGSPESVNYNTEKLSEVFEPSIAAAIAEAVKTVAEDNAEHLSAVRDYLDASVEYLGDSLIEGGYDSLSVRRVAGSDHNPVEVIMTARRVPSFRNC